MRSTKPTASLRQSETRSTQVTAVSTPQRRRTTAPACPRCQRTFRARIGLIGHLRIDWTARTAPIVVSPPASSSSSPPPTISDWSSESPHLSSSSSASSSSSCAASTTPAMAAGTHGNTTHIPDTATDITPTASGSGGEDQVYTCPHGDRTFISHIGLVGHLRIHRTEAGEPVSGALDYTNRTRPHCPHCLRTLTHRMGLFGHMRIHEDLR
nr:unnamed protein product [Spirometra erinaceieuropaei]